MRHVLVAALVALGAGCFGEGLSSSTTRCDDVPAPAAGFLLNVTDPGLLVGRCVAIAKDGDLDRKIGLSKLGEDGLAYVPVPGEGRYYMSVSATLPNDRYCARHVGEFREHPGSGVVEAKAEAGTICA
ncbi:MAG: hypothetical protein HYT80_07945 [Euryarchaeota archaeon]|nr:hypothetical protein [Euryarchaeota archaeon]